MTEESIIDVILEIRDNQRKLDKRLALMEHNLAILNSKANGELIAAVREHISVDAIKIGKPELKAPVSKKPAPKISKGSAQPRKNTNVFGTIVNGRSKRLADVTVKIMNTKGEVLKVVTTNRAGLWRAFLPPGKYSAEYTKAGLPPQFRVIEIKEGMKELQVT